VPRKPVARVERSGTRERHCPGPPGFRYGLEDPIGGCDILIVMSKAVQQLLERVASWPQEDIEKLEEAISAIEAWRSGVYYPTEEELREIDAGIAELDRGDAATDDDVRRVLPSLRRR